jgi:hypothetical protein
VLIRDYKSKCIDVCAKYPSFVVDAMITEVYAPREGLLLAHYLGCNCFTIQSNNTEVMESMKEGGSSATAALLIFYDCNMLASCFRKTSFEPELICSWLSTKIKK